MKLTIVLLLFILISGCDLLKNVGGFDLTACEDNWLVCTELAWDNI